MVLHFSLVSRITAALRASRACRWLTSNYPKTAAFLARRLCWSDPLGLKITLGFAAGGLCLFAFFGIVQDLIATDPLIRSDLRVITLLQTLRSSRFTAAMAFFTYLGNWQIVVGTATLFGLLLYFRRQWWWLISFLVALGSGELIVQLVKFAFARQRPDLHNALIPAAGASFPSGHAFAAMVVYGIVTAYLMTRVRTMLARIGLALVGAAIVSLVGFSRIYLGVHWPSDVLASFALGSGWPLVTFAGTFVVMNRRSYPFQGFDRGKLWLEPILPMVWLVAAGLFYITHPLPSLATVERPPIAVTTADPSTALFEQFPRYTEDVTGTRVEPINIVIVGPSSDLFRTFGDAGWQPAAPLSFTSIAALVIAEMRNRPDPTGPGLPVFWDARPNDLTFERPTSQETARERHHLHLWITPFRMGRYTIWAGTVHLDKTGRATALGLPFHQIDPSVDREREALLADLKRSRCLRKTSEITVTEQLSGVNELGSPFFTDGKAEELWIDCELP